MADTRLEHLLSTNRQDGMSARKKHFPAPSERTMRRAITVLAALGVIIASFASITILGNVSNHHRQENIRQLSTLLQLAASRLDDISREGETVRAPVREDLTRLLPDFAFREGRLFLVLDNGGRIIALAGATDAHPALQGGAQPPEALAKLAAAAGGQIRALSLPGSEAPLLAGAMRLSTWPGMVVALQPQSSSWTTYANALQGCLLGLTIILIALLALYNWQADQTEQESRDHLDFINRLETALELGRCGLWDWDIARGRIYLTHSMRELLGLPQPQGQLDGYVDLADFLELQHPEEPRIDELLEKQLRSDMETFEQELRLRNQVNGTWLWLKLRGALPGDTENAPHLVGIAIDITAQKRAAAEKRNAEQQLNQAIESISESFALWDAGMRLVKCNSKFREFHGLPEDACHPGRPYAEIMREARCRCQRREFRHVLHNAQGRETVMEMELADGRWLLISERQMESGGCVSVGTDITELKRKQLELEKSQQELRQTVEALERSQAEINDKNRRLRQMARSYQQARDRAEQALIMKSQILANVSHELFTPLNHILMPADMMRQQALGPLAEAYVEYAREIHQAGEEIRRKITDIMEYAELSTGKASPQYERFVVKDMLAEVVERFVPAAEEKGVELSWRAAAKGVAIADRGRVMQALRQLLDNAVSFTHEGEISVRAEVDGEGTLKVEVRDTGVGIPPEMMDRICQPFERAGNAYNAHDGGSGIGLAIAQTVAGMHGGRLEIESEVGKGTCVRIILPRQEVSHPASEDTFLRQPAE